MLLHTTCVCVNVCVSVFVIVFPHERAGWAGSQSFESIQTLLRIAPLKIHHHHRRRRRRHHHLIYNGVCVSLCVCVCDIVACKVNGKSKLLMKLKI